MKSKFKLMPLLLFFIFCLGGVSLAQETTGRIEGTIKDPNGSVVPGVSVTVTSSGNTSGFNATIETSADGYYQFLRVPPGTYTVSTNEAKGFGSKTINNVTVSVDRATLVNLDLAIGGGNVVVDVSATETPQIDPTESKLTANITAQLADALPEGDDVRQSAEDRSKCSTRTARRRISN